MSNLEEKFISREGVYGGSVLNVVNDTVLLPNGEEAVREFAKKGINCIEYRDGRRVNIADYVYMALRTANTRANLLGQAKQRMALGIDTVRVSSYNACSETCLPWQGGIYIDDVFATFDGEISGDKGKSKNGNCKRFI